MTNQKSIVISGVSSGIGFALAASLITRGYRVFGTIRKPGDADPLSQINRDLFTPIVTDITDKNAVQNAVTLVAEQLSGAPLFGLINNAGINIMGPTLYQPIEEIRKIFEVNVFSAIGFSQAFLQLLLGNGSRRAGRIINISSVSGGYAVPFLGAYSGSKHALEAFTQSMRRELIPQGIHVCAIEPNFIKSKITDEAFDRSIYQRYQHSPLAKAWQAFIANVKQQAKNAASPNIVVEAALHALESSKPKTRYPLHSSWQIGRWLPDKTFDKILFKNSGLASHLK